MPQHRIPLKSYHYSPQGKRTEETLARAAVTIETERAKWLNLDVYDDDDDDDKDKWTNT
jgi:hypothetical protein